MKTQETTTSKTATNAKKGQPGKGAAKTAAKAAKTPRGTAKISIPKTTKATKPLTVKEAARAASKTAIVLELLRRDQGATLAEIAKTTDWQNHSIRGFVSGQVGKKMGLKIESTKNEAGERTYRILG
jgi:hypothetical protein